MDKKSFSAASGIKDLIGRDLITSDEIAIFELVKNSYDAYASKVVITFDYNRIVIADNGKGMSIKDIDEKWLKIGFSAKRDGTEDDDKQKSYRDNIRRFYAGAKGIGRFSCDRLGKKLELKTKTKKNNLYDVIRIDWEKFEKDQRKKIDDVKFDHEQIVEKIVFPQKKNSGTILEITDLRDAWDRDKILNLKRSLEKLINPFSETQGFEIEIICENEKTRDLTETHDSKIVNGTIKNSILDVINLKTTKIEVRLDGTTIETTLTDRDVIVYKIREKNKYKSLSSAQICLYFLNKSAKINFKKVMNVDLVGYGSIFLFRNGFRILPYGNNGDDSWGLDHRAAQGYNRFLGTRDLFGRVDVQSNDINEFKEVSSRDGGLIESEATLQLKNFFDTAHRRLERYVVGVLWGEGFLKKEYFKNVELAYKSRELLKNDKNLSSPEVVIKENLGSKIDFVQLIKALIFDKNIEVEYYNKDLINIFDDPSLFDEANPQIIDELDDLAKNVVDSNWLNSYESIKQKVKKLQKEKETAEKRADEAEAKMREEEAAKDQAQYEAKYAKAQQARAEAKSAQIERENMFLTSDVNSDVKQLISLQHTITHTSHSIRSTLDDAMEAAKNKDIDTIVAKLNDIYLLNQQVETISGLVSKVNYNVRANKINKDFIAFVNDYIENFCQTSYKEFSFHVAQTDAIWETKFEAIKIIIIIDNLLSNSSKFDAKNIYIDWKISSDFIDLIYRDDGAGIPEENMSKIFNYRFSTTDGGGLGLYHVKTIMESDFSGTVKAQSKKGNGAEFALHFSKRGMK
ncbi:ATP-binding protein [Fibrobacter sp.]|uniref:ATP-binding protein n=1 Tax=Fibrobacter sp. TaxID=35828 RepID=UPI00260BC842|nr:ATP-binding protein [Fibrobacter sp.]MDD5942886.1 ATP-binding protein [Fibrobacter sp.]